MSSDNRSPMHLELNSSELQRSRTMSLSELAIDELLSPLKTTGNCRSVVSAAMTPTPTQFLFPTSVTAEQEAYASGFSRALEEIYRSEGQPANQPKMVESTVNMPSYSCSQLTPLNAVRSFTYTPSYSLAPTGVWSNVTWPVTKVEDSVRNKPPSHFDQPGKSYLSDLSTAVSSSIYAHCPQLTSMQVENQGRCQTNWPTVTVFGTSSMKTSVAGASSMYSAADSTVNIPSTKLDMDEQEQLKLERKRAKNRVAAARCQMRKVERIARLQEKVQELRNNNARLEQTVVELTHHVSNLRKQILVHTECGCRMMIPAIS